MASDGDALALLKKEFPNLPSIGLPSYRIRYSKFAYLTKWKLLFSFHLIRQLSSALDAQLYELVTNVYFVTNS